MILVAILVAYAVTFRRTKDEGRAVLAMLATTIVGAITVLVVAELTEGPTTLTPLDGQEVVVTEKHYVLPDGTALDHENTVIYSLTPTTLVTKCIKPVPVWMFGTQGCLSEGSELQ